MKYIIFLLLVTFQETHTSSQPLTITFREIIKDFSISYENSITFSRDRISTELNIPRNSDKYYAILRSIKDIQTHYEIYLQLLHDPIKKSADAWRSLLFLAPQITSLSLENFAHNHLDTTSLQQLVRFTALTELSLSGVDLNYDAFDTFHTNQTLVDSIQELTQLRTLSLGNINPFHRPCHITDTQLITIISALQKLYSLSLCSSHIDNENNALGDCIESATYLEKLDISGCPSMSYHSTSSFLSSLQRATSLASVGLYTSSAIAPLINHYVSTTSSLKKLILQYDLKETDNSIYGALKYNTSITNLKFYHLGSLPQWHIINEMLQRNQLHKITILYNPYGPEDKYDDDYEFETWRSIDRSLEKNISLRKLIINPDILPEKHCQILANQVTARIHQNTLRHQSLLSLLQE